MSIRSSVNHAWPAFLAAGVLASVALYVTLGAAREAEAALDFFTWTALGLVGIAFVCEFVDSSLGMGYGTLLTPVLAIFLGLKAVEVVPAVLFSELCTGILSGISHHRIGNVSLHPRQRPFKVALVLVSCSVVAALVGAKLASSIPDWLLKAFIAVIVLAMGVVILAFRNSRFGFSWLRIGALGFTASFNKGLSGGGYGPLVMSGQVLSGVEAKSAVGITALAEGLTCVVGVTTYIVILRHAMPWHLAVPMAFGAILSVPFAAWMVSRIPARKFTIAIGIWTVVLGILSVWKVYPAVVKAFS